MVVEDLFAIVVPVAVVVPVDPQIDVRVLVVRLEDVADEVEFAGDERRRIDDKLSFGFVVECVVVVAQCIWVRLTVGVGVGRERRQPKPRRGNSLRMVKAWTSMASLSVTALASISEFQVL